MNKQCFRVIFSKTLQRLIVTSELAKSADKSKSVKRAVSFDHIFASLKPLALSLFCALGLVTLSFPALAETLIIKADPNAPKNQQPIVLNTANGLPQVNIQTPNSKGLSHNKYQDFNVDAKGAILNNSRKPTQTQQAGFIQGNPYLAKGEAKVILNEVTSNKPSQLKGYIEIAGQKAEMIIANPNGLSCEDCGTINSYRATLTTGKPQIKDGRIEGVKVEKGKVKVSGKGLDNSRVDYTDILAREAEINAGVWAGKKLNVVTGKNDIKQASLEYADSDLIITRNDAKNLAENVPHFALDVSELGGMYAGKIHLVGTEQGLGVRNAGHIGASSDTLAIDSQGKIVNSGILNAQQKISLKTAKDIENTGRIEAKTQNIELHSRADIAQNGSIIAHTGEVKINAKNKLSQSGEAVAKGKISYNAAEIKTTQSSLIAAGVTTTQTTNSEARQLDGQNIQGSSVDIQAENTAQLTGRNIASGKLNVAAQSVNLDQSQNTAYDIAVQAKSGDVIADRAQLNAIENLQISTPKRLTTQRSQLTANRIQTSQNNLNTQYAIWKQSGTDDFNLNAHTIQNQGGIFAASGNFNLNAENVDNTDGQLIAGRNLNIHTAGAFNSTQGTLFSNNALKLQTAQLTNTNGLIKSIGNMHIDTGKNDLFNQQTNKNNDIQKGIIALGNLVINGAVLHNTNGFIGSNQNMEIDADNVRNDSGKLYAAQHANLQLNNGYYSSFGQLQADSLSLTTPSIEQHQAGITVNKKLDIIANKLISANNSTISANEIDITLANSLTQSESNIIANQSNNINVQGKLNNSNSTIASRYGNLAINTNNSLLNNTNSTLFAQQNIKLNSGMLNNTMGVIGSQGEIAVDTQGAALNNFQGQVFANTTKLNTGAINNQQGLLRGDKALVIDTQTLTNAKGVINAQQQTTIQAAQIDNRSGTIWGANTHLNATTVNNQQNGQTGSLIGATDTLAITTTQLNNQQTVATGTHPTQGLQAKNIQLNADTLNNQQGGIYATNSAFATIKHQLNNQAGEILAGKTAQIHSKANNLVVDNQDGTIEAGQQLSLNAKTLQDEGTLKTQGNAEITLTDSFILNRAFQVGNNLTFSTQGDFVNNVKQVVGNQASFTATNLVNNANAEISSNRTLINTKAVTNYGLLDGTENIIKTDTLNNIGTGRIYGDHLAIQADNLNNLGNGEKSATIAARHRLDLGVGALINRDHSLIFSVGDITIGGQLNEQNKATDYAKLVDNGSATIEALGNGDIKTQRLLNQDLYLKLGESHTDEHIIEYAPSNSSTRYALLNKDGGEGTFDLKNNNKHDSNSYFILKDGSRIPSRYWTRWDYNRHTVTSTIEHRDPAKILIGGNLSLSGSDLENNASTLSIGKALLLGDSIFTRNENNGNLTAGGVTLKNLDIQGKINITDTGRWESFGKEYRRYGVRFQKRWAVYGNGSGNTNDIQPTQHFTFNKVLNEIGNEIIGTNTTIDRQSNSAPIALKTLSNTNLPVIEQGNIAVPTVSAVISGQVSANHPENLGAGTQPMIKTHLPEITLPQASLYQINPDAPNGYLVETDSRFTDRKQWLSSDYMFNALRYDHNTVHKRLGDGFYEQRLVNEQINQLTGRRFLDNYSSDFEQYKALMDSGVYYADKFKLTPGVGLTSEQMAELTSDMVWLVNKEVTLPSGKTLTVLTPQVYLVARNLDVTPQGALISAREIVANINGDITNTGTIAGRDLTSLSAKNISNNGVFLGHTVNLLAKQKLVNLGGKIQAFDSATLVGGNGVEISSTTSSSQNHDRFGNAFAHTNIDRQAEIDVKGKLTIYSPKDVVLKAANVNADVIHLQGDKVELGTVNTANKQHYNADADNYYRLDQTQEVGSNLNAKSDVAIVSENHTVLRQATVHSDSGTVAIASHNGDVQIQEGRGQEQLASGSKNTQKSLFRTTTTTVKHDHNYDIAQGSTIDGNNVLLQANKGNVAIQGSNVVAENHLTATAKNIHIQEAENRIFEQDVEKTSKSGLMGSGGFGFSIGQRKETTETDQTKYTATQSQVGSLSGNTTLQAGGNYQQSASAVTAVKGDVTIQAQNVDVLAASNKYETNYKRTYEKKGLTISINTPIQTAMNAVKNVTETVKTIGESKDDRINAMAAANAGWNTYRAGQTLGNIGKELGELMKNGTVPTEAVSVSITYGEQKSVDTTHTEGSTANSSQVNAGGKVTITAAGANKQSNINVIGSDVSGKQGTVLTADNDINLNAQQQTHKERTQNKSSGFNAGVAIAVGNGVSFGITAGGNYGKGYSNGDDVTYRNTHIGDSSSQTIINAGNNATLKGSQVQGNNVILNAENLSIESLQDTMKYQGKQMNVEGQVTVGYGFSASGSYNQSKINADYASVVKQSGIYAGDGGYQINVGNHTALTGGIVTSSEKAEQDDKNSFSTGTLSATDIENYANYSGSGFGLDGGLTMSGGNAPKEIGGMKPQQIGSNHLDGTSKTELGGIAGIGSQGNWGITKGVVTALLGQVSDRDSENGITTSSINTSNIRIRDTIKQKELTGKTAKETIYAINKENVHQLVTKTNMEQAKSDLQRDLSTATSFVNNLNNSGDDIYYNMEKNEDSLSAIKKKSEDCNHISCLDFDIDNSQELKTMIYGNQPLTEKQAKLLSKVATAGMLNLEREDKVSSAILYDKDLKNIDETSVILNRGSAGYVNEVTFTLFERFRAWVNVPMIFGASNATRDHAQIAKKLDEYNAYAIQNNKPTYDLNNVAHSLGVSGNKNMLNWSEYVGNKYSNTEVKFLHLGGSYPSEEIDKQAQGLFKETNTQYHGVEGDLVYSGWGGLFIGNNPNATKVKGLRFEQAHSDANQNINNLQYIYNTKNNDYEKKWKETESVLRKIHPNGIRIFNTVGEDK